MGIHINRIFCRRSYVECNKRICKEEEVTRQANFSNQKNCMKSPQPAQHLATQAGEHKKVYNFSMLNDVDVGKMAKKRGAKRRRKALRENIQSITKPDIRRLARRGDKEDMESRRQSPKKHILAYEGKRYKILNGRRSVLLNVTKEWTNLV
uniref:Uncharacterized protein n=1 Tax=Glossina palpalis gambiensis TaxID=67801 RepID=A0A1B0C459_9MUSC